MEFKVIGLVSVLGLVACGSGSESDTGQKIVTKQITQNVALTSNGATMSATYNQESAAYIGDGDTTSSTFWAGNIADDQVTVDFGQVAKVADVTVYTSDTSYSSSDPAVQVELSVDGQSWKTTMVPSFGSSDIACPTYTSGSGKLSCTFASVENARYLRITTNAASVSIYEVEATGTVTVSVTEDSNIEDSGNELTFLEGSWLSACEDYNEDATVYGQSTFTFDAANITVVNRTYANSSCEGNTLIVLETVGNVTVGDDVVLASGETVTQVAFEYTEQTMLLNTQDDVTQKNNESECGYTDWALGVEKDVFACRIGEDSTALEISLIVGGELYLGETPEEGGYPTELTDSPLTQL